MNGQRRSKADLLLGSGNLAAWFPAVEKALDKRRKPFTFHAKYGNIRQSLFMRN
jgi:hypothetical protein